MIANPHVDYLHEKYIQSEGSSAKFSGASWNNLPQGIKHLKVIELWGQKFVRKSYNDKESIRSRSFWLMQHEAGLCITPPIFSVSPTEASEHGVSSGIFCQLVPGAKDVYTLMLENALGCQDPRLSKINSHNIRDIVIMDVLTGNYRHGGNILVSPNGQVRGIDHHFAFSHNYGGVGKICGTLIGETLKIRWSFQLQDLLDTTHLATRLDYIRHSGCIRTDYPSNILKLMRKLRGMGDKEIIKRYGLPEADVRALKLRLKWMLERGLEETIKELVKRRDDAHQELVRAGQWIPDEAQLLYGRIKSIFGAVPALCRERYAYASDSLCSGVRHPKTVRRQPMYRCDTCSDFMCKACTYTCHKNHRFRFVGVIKGVCACSAPTHRANHSPKNISRFEPRVGTQCWFNAANHPMFKAFNPPPNPNANPNPNLTTSCIDATAVTDNAARWVNGVVLRRHADGSCDFYVTRSQKKSIVRKVNVDDIISHETFLGMEGENDELCISTYFDHT